MIKPSSHFDKDGNGVDADSPARPHMRSAEDKALSQRLSAEERRKKFEAALADTIEKYDWALRKLAE